MLHNDPVAAAVPDVTAWRHAIHADPELGFQERRTAAFVAERLRSFGLEVHEGIAGTGVVGVLRRGNGGGRIGLRAELDALPVARENRPALCLAQCRDHACLRP